MNIMNKLKAGLLAGVLFLSLGMAAWADNQGAFRAGPLKVVTQNLYVGGDILLPLSVPPADFPAAAAEVIDQIVATNFPERAMKLADLIRRGQPDLVGLQEVYVVKVCLEALPTLCPVDLDYLEILLENLNGRVEHYREVATVTNIDIQSLPVELPDGTDVIVSITDRDVILAHHQVGTANVLADNYDAALPVDNPLLPGFRVLRGYAMVDADVRGRTYRFVNTHLEISGAGSDLEPLFRLVQAAQALELVTLLQQQDEHTQVIVGDFNSDPSEAPIVLCGVPDGDGGFDTFPCPTPYATLFDANYTDTWLYRNGPFDFGFTCCQDTLLDNEFSKLDERIDLVWARQAGDYVGPPFLINVRANVFGDGVGDKTVPGGLWPSDHGGVAAQLIIRATK